MTSLNGSHRELIEGHIHLVGYHVSEMLNRVPPQVTRDELASAGYLALTQAAISFDETSGVPFGRYAAIRIRGALIDELRSMDWVSRGARRKIREYTKTVEVMTADLGREPNREEIATSLGVDPTEVDSIKDTATTKVLSYDAYDGSLALTVPANSPTPENTALTAESYVYLRSAVEALPERLRYVVEQIFFNERMVTDVAEEMGLTQSRVSQLRSEAMVLLRDGLNTHLDPELVRNDEKQGVAQRRRTAYFDEIGKRVETNVRASRNALAVRAATMQRFAVEQAAPATEMIS
ncbi:sigma-70 family RNA polymerase sigma factor [Timonella sp. A28]|uniref:sigma-70 family RNA polymerase sigma factor n=1 Tax=Timonella sp. A28 TaxID=3442640 RepID=UPI003EBF6456